jgi:predicted transcriptional regulator
MLLPQKRTDMPDRFTLFGRHPIFTKEGTMRVQGIPPEGFRTVGQISGTNELMFRGRQNGLAVAIELLESHASGAPVVDDADKLIGFISEFDILRTLQTGKDLAKVKADEIMTSCPIIIKESTTVEEAVKIMEDLHLLVLPVERDGTIAYSVTRHDLLRAWIGLGPGVEKQP